MMLQPRAIILRPRRLGWIEPSVLSIRQFSTPCSLKTDSPSTPSRPPRSSTGQPKKLKVPPALLKFNSSSPDKPRPRRVIDARSLAASKPGGRPANIIKGPRQPGGRGRPPQRGRGQFDTKSSSKGPKKADRSRRPKPSGDENTGDEQEQAEELENVYRELAEETKPTPTRYQPQPPSLQNLNESWPSFPTDVTATTAGIAEKLSLLSDRSPNSYEPPHELAKRLYHGKYVHFKSQAERDEAVQAAQKLAQESADGATVKRGEIVDPRTIDFRAVQSRERKFLIESLAQGKYPMVNSAEAKSPIVGDILRNLRNNETYQSAGKRSQFMAKVESLLHTKKPAKRA